MRVWDTTFGEAVAAIAHTVGCRARAVSPSEWLFLVAFALCAFATLLIRTTHYDVPLVPRDSFVNASYVLASVLLLAKLLVFRPARCARFVLAIGIVAVGAASFAVTGEWRFCLPFLFIAAGEGVRLRRLAWIVLLVQLAVMAWTIPLAVLGRIESFDVWRMVDGTWKPRSSYGYSHPNMLGEAFLAVALSFFALRFPRFQAVDLIVYGLAFAGAAFLVWSRTSAACIVLVIVFALLSRILCATPPRQRAAAGTALVAFVALAAFSLYMMACYDQNSAWMSALNEVLSNRPILSNRFFSNFSPMPFGNKTMLVCLDEFIQSSPDNAYVRMVMKQGVIPAVVLGALCLHAYWYAWKHSVFDACIVGLLVYAMLGVMEAYSLNFSLNYFLIGAAWALYDDWPNELRATCSDVSIDSEDEVEPDRTQVAHGHV